MNHRTMEIIITYLEIRLDRFNTSINQIKTIHTIKFCKLVILNLGCGLKPPPCFGELPPNLLNNVRADVYSLLHLRLPLQEVLPR